jgi:uncharacterized lipoprotein YddW (UPF0748 family)
VRKNGLTHYQDAQAWIEQGLVDAVFLMNYTPKVEEFDERIDPWLAVGGEARVIPGMMVRRGGERATDLATCRELVNTARARTGDYCVFAYSAIFNRRDNEFRPEFVAFLNGLAEVDGK